MMQPIRLGEISFINALPLRLGADTRFACDLRPPASLNQAMLLGELDVSAVSSAFYLRHQDRFILLDDLSISAENAVQSVLLFLPDNIENLSALKKTMSVAVPTVSETSIALMQYLIFRNNGFTPTRQLDVYHPGEAAARLDQGQPVLVIGNEALLLRETRSEQYIDLGQAWQTEMGLPFVFGVWVADRDWAEANPEALQTAQLALLDQKTRFLTSPAMQARVVHQAHRTCPEQSKDQLQQYYITALSYNLTDHHRMALTWFKEILKWLDNDIRTESDGPRAVLSV